MAASELPTVVASEGPHRSTFVFNDVDEHGVVRIVHGPLLCTVTGEEVFYPP